MEIFSLYICLVLAHLFIFHIKLYLDTCWFFSHIHPFAAFPDEDMKMAYKSRSPRSMAVLGFTEAKRIPYWIRAGNQVLVVTARDNDDVSWTPNSFLPSRSSVCDYLMYYIERYHFIISSC